MIQMWDVVVWQWNVLTGSCVKHMDLAWFPTKFWEVVETLGGDVWLAEARAGLWRLFLAPGPCLFFWTCPPYDEEASPNISTIWTFCPRIRNQATMDWNLWTHKKIFFNTLCMAVGHRRERYTCHIMLPPGGLPVWTRTPNTAPRHWYLGKKLSKSGLSYGFLESRQSKRFVEDLASECSVWLRLFAQQDGRFHNSSVDSG